jgi:hypothetical protein
MSTVFRIECHQDGEKGPQLKRSAGGVALLDPEAWAAYLIEHEFHPMELWRDE